ncbi:MAG: NAD(P)/FAD-dependent oxidoreductase, partial [Clostridia bacterium]|nr:NAD(P)/FAD-dependent oxidoreductase [Clostridia bacterium]
MIRIDGLRAGIGDDFSLEDIAARQLRIGRSEISSVRILRRALDCRKKGDIHYAFSLGVELKRDEQKVAKLSRNQGVRVCDKPLSGIDEYLSKNNLLGKLGRVAVVGSGPAGLMCALTLAKAGMQPTVIERGKQVEERIKDVNTFFQGGALNTESNVQYGEGGAGTFSDGKLNSGVGGEIAAIVLSEFARHGGGEQLVYEGKPHIGTDVLPNVVSQIRNEIIRLGGKFMFSTKVDGIICKGGALIGLSLTGENAGCFDCDTAVFAIGHSARDTYEMLARNNVLMAPKPFSIGVRIEHRQQDINIAQYGCVRN